MIMKKITEKKLKPIIVDRETYRIMQKIWGSKVPYNPTIKEEEVKEKDECNG